MPRAKSRSRSASPTHASDGEVTPKDRSRSPRRDARRTPRSRSPDQTRRRSRSRSPRRDRRRDSYSRSPPRRQTRRSPSPRPPRGPKRKDGGFRWKETRRNETGDGGRDTDRRLERGYQGHYRSQPSRPDEDPPREERSGKKEDPQDAIKSKEKKEKKKKRPVVEEPMITVTVNDRLGTKAAIKCFASDPLPLFKAQVAARTGRRPHEILLKRQGERPLTGNRSLDDYLISDGVQLDLEVDTGD